MLLACANFVFDSSTKSGHVPEKPCQNKACSSQLKPPLIACGQRLFIFSWHWTDAKVRPHALATAVNAALSREALIGSLNTDFTLPFKQPNSRDVVSGESWRKSSPQTRFWRLLQRLYSSLNPHTPGGRGTAWGGRWRRQRRMVDSQYYCTPSPLSTFFFT